MATDISTVEEFTKDTYALDIGEIDFTMLDLDFAELDELQPPDLEIRIPDFDVGDD